MHKFTSFFVFISLISGSTIFAQTINWQRLDPSHRHLLNLNAGWDYALTYGISYAYQPRTRLPMLLNIEQSHPSGKAILEDFKTKIGVQNRWLQVGDFQVSTKIQGIFRRFENPAARLANFGCETSATAGYYRSKWFLAGEMGFDKAIATHFKHSDSYRENFPGVQDGWYEPSTGGNFFYGLLAGISVKKSDFYVKASKVRTQDFKTTPFIPFSAQLGWTRRL